MRSNRIRKTESSGKHAGPISAVQKRVVIQASLAVITILLTVVLIFAMTRAWYTNVVESTGLTLETQSWGFLGEAEVGTDTIDIAPGQSGIIPIRVYNQDSDLIFAAVSVSKSTMTETEMKKRLYFYVDASTQVNGETVDKVYLNSSSEYAYLVLSDQELNLSQDYCTDVPVKWEWVYDMTGYYFQGTVNASANTVTVEDYLCPVEYNPDTATYNEDGTLATTDGTTTVEEFLAQLSKTDGYESDIDPNPALEGYYKVAVDGTGYGVWVHLCSYSEMLAATAYDSEIGAGTRQLSETVSLTIRAENTKEAGAAVSTAEDLMEILTGTDTRAVSLSGDITLNEDVAVDEGTAVVDLDGHTLTLAGSISVTGDSSLMLSNGTVDSTGSGTTMTVGDSSLILSDLTLKGSATAISVTDQDSDSVIRISGCDISGIDNAIIVRGNGSATEALTTLIVENSTVRGESNVAISGNGSNEPGLECWGTDIQIINSTVWGCWCGIYQPATDSSLTIYNSTVSGITGVTLKGGTASIIDSVIAGTGTGDEITAPTESNASLGGFLDTGAGIYVENSYENGVTVSVSGDTTDVSGAEADAILIHPSGKDGVTVSVSGGSFSSSVSSWLAKGCSETEVGGSWVVTS